MSFEYHTYPAEPLGACTRESDLHVMHYSQFPIWVFDVDTAHIVWANEAAEELWEAESLEELLDRDLSGDMSSSVRERLLQYLDQFRNGAMFDESWTLYPNGKPKTIKCRFRGCIKIDGAMAMLCEAREIKEQSHEVLRGSQALLYTGAMVSTYDKNGRCLYANPAALRAFGQKSGQLQDRILNDYALQTLMETAMQGQEGLVISDVMTTRGPRIHEIEARRSMDAVDGVNTLLLTELDITEREHAKRAVERLANQDMLTGLFNRTFLATHANSYIETAFEEGQGIFLMLFDLDRFKDVNDTLGHAVGDRLLAEVAERLRSFFPKEAILGRLGGDEFCVLVKSDVRLSDMSKIAGKFVRNLKKPVKIDNHELRIYSSLGICHATADTGPDNFDDLLVRADLAQYEAKNLGGGQVRPYRDALSHQRERFLSIEAELSHALSGNCDDLTLCFQPQVCHETGRATGAEALARLTTRDGKPLGPTDFIPVAEETGLILELGHWVLEQTVEAYMTLPEHMKPYRFSVNVAPTQFHGPELLGQLRRFACKPGFSPDYLELELTESQLHLGDWRFNEKLRKIVDLGYRISIDDFGTGYSNIARLNKHPIQCIKIDRSLICERENKNLANGVINMGKALKLRVIAEGVETLRQRDWLIEQGCHEHQGFLYAKPLCLDELAQFDARAAHVRTDKGRI